MKLHDLRPADGSRQPRTRVGRGIAAGKGKTAGRGTKGQKARAGGSIPPWFEGGQTPLHMRIPKLRGFKNRFKVEYEVVNIGAIGALADGGAFEFEGDAKKSTKSGPITVNQDILRAVGLVRTLNKPLKILGAGELSVALFVVADAFTGSARAKIEAAGGSVNVLEVPTSPLTALGVTPQAEGAATPAGKATAKPKAVGSPAAKVDVPDDAVADAETTPEEGPAARGKANADKGPDAAPAARADGGQKAAKRPSGGAPKAKASTRKAQTPEVAGEAPEAVAAPAADDAPDEGVDTAAAETAPDTDEPTASEAVTPSDDDA
jgi:large subunit ribosomal protein L15